MSDTPSPDDLFQHYLEGVKSVIVKLKEHQPKAQLYAKNINESLANIRFVEERRDLLEGEYALYNQLLHRILEKRSVKFMNWLRPYLAEVYILQATLNEIEKRATETVVSKKCKHYTTYMREFEKYLHQARSLIKQLLSLALTPASQILL